MTGTVTLGSAEGDDDLKTRANAENDLVRIRRGVGIEDGLPQRAGTRIGRGAHQKAREHHAQFQVVAVRLKWLPVFFKHGVSSPTAQLRNRARS